MAKVFLSYRRKDPLPEWSVKRIGAMCLECGFNEVFVDRDSGAIPVGSDYAKEIEKAVRACDVILVLIGEKWQSILDARSNDPTDMVQLEIGLGLELEKKLVPILLGGQMPKVNDLPDRLRPFHFKNGRSFESDTLDSFLPLLLKELVEEFETKPRSQVGEKPTVQITNPLQSFTTLADQRGREKAVQAARIAQRKESWIQQFRQFQTLRQHLKTDEIQGALQTLCNHWKVIYPVKWDGQSELFSTWEGESPVIKIATFEEEIDIGNGLYIRFNYIRAGTFERKGSFFRRKCSKVTLTEGFWMAKFPITQGQWMKIMEDNPSCFKDAGANAPVENVSWEDIQEFLGKVDKGLDLPTEAQWEYACRAGNTGSYNVQELPLKDLCWYEKNSGRSTHPVGEKVANAWGLHDMHGNVWEWCRDRYSDYSGCDEVDPKGPQNGSDYVLRGGSWSSSATRCKSAYRFWHGANDRYWNYGFRLCLIPSRGGKLIFNRIDH